MTALIIISALALMSYIWYVIIILKRNKVLESLSTVDVQLKQRLDVIPNILTIAQKFMEHEKTLLSDITELRAKAAGAYDKSQPATIRDHLIISEKISEQMGKLLISVENYPDLKSDQTMLQAMRSYNEVEAQIAAARRFYNSNVNALNNSIQIFPGSIFAKLAGIANMPFFEAEQIAHKSIDAKDYLGGR